MPARKVAARAVVEKSERKSPSDREVRLECLKIAIEMRAGVTRAPDTIDVAEKFFQYVEDGLN